MFVFYEQYNEQYNEAKFANNNMNWETFMGTRGIGVKNENGKLFAELCMNNNLVIRGTCSLILKTGEDFLGFINYEWMEGYRMKHGFL